MVVMTMMYDGEVLTVVFMVKLISYHVFQIGILLNIGLR